MRLIDDNSTLLMSLIKMSEQISRIYGSSLYKVILYGSYVRGDQTPESDVDIAVVVKDGDTEKMHDELLDLVVDYELELAVTLSVVPIRYEEYKEWSRVLPYYKNIAREGIVLWKEV